MHEIQIYDTTLRDGTQGKDVNFTLKDKISIVELLDSVGINYIELGWPFSNPKDMETFKVASKMKLKNAKIAAFCSTRKKGTLAKEDAGLLGVIESKAPAVSIFGKTCLNHIKLQLKATPEENLEMIFDSVRFLKDSGLEVFYDAEHFFDGYNANSEYAVKCINTAVDAGADIIILCDTNGGTLPNEINSIVKKLKEYYKNNKNFSKDVKFGIHCHNDSGCGVANSIICADYLVQIQGTINGFGERTGNADLIQIIPALEFKLKKKTTFNLQRLKEVSDKLYMLANVREVPSQPYVGKNAFSHKAGVHVDAISKGASYEHLEPMSIGNERSFVLSDLSGSANIVEVLSGYGISVDKNDKRVKEMLDEVKSLEKKGYGISDLEAEKFLLSQKYFSPTETFVLSSWKIITEMKKNVERSECFLTGKIFTSTPKSELVEVHSVVENQGPVDSAYIALKKFLDKDYSNTRKVNLINYKVMIAEDDGAKSSVRVYIEFSDGNKSFATIGVSKNILEASMEAIEKGFRYYILRNNIK